MRRISAPPIASTVTPRGERARECAGDELRVRGDSLELELVVVNLLRNASQAIQSIGKPEIRVRIFDRPGPGFEVSDNGVGLTEEKLAEIVQIGESTRPEGLGLGLSIVRDLVELHEGKIEFSLTPAGGLVVRVTLPPVREPDKECEK